MPEVALGVGAMDVPNAEQHLATLLQKVTTATGRCGQGYLSFHADKGLRRHVAIADPCAQPRDPAANLVGLHEKLRHAEEAGHARKRRQDRAGCIAHVQQARIKDLL
eukprot:scaffold76843_cov30-Tisochrysis_lutea.AAC.2